MVGTTPQRPSPRVGPFVALVVGVVVMALVACTREEPIASPTTVVSAGTTASSAGTTSTTAPNLLEDVDAVLVTDKVWDPETMEAIRDYVRSQQAQLRAGMSPVNPNHPDLLKYMTEDALSRQQQGLLEDIARGHSIGVPTVFRIHPEVAERQDASSIELTSCYTSNEPLVNASDQKVISADVFSYRTKNRLVRTGSVWQLAYEQALGDWSGDSCAQ